MAKKTSKKPMTGKAMKKTKGGLAAAKYAETMNVSAASLVDARAMQGSMASNPASAIDPTAIKSRLATK